MDEAAACYLLLTHQDELPRQLRQEHLDTMSEDHSFSPELREVFAYLRDHPGVFFKLDTADKGGKGDGVIGRSDCAVAAGWPETMAYSRQKAACYASCYIPSDASDDELQLRPITTNDAYRELYLHADSLPDPLDRQGLQRIVDGQCTKKCTPQLQAAALFLLGHSEAFNKIAPGGRVGRGTLQDKALAKIHLRPEEWKAIETMQQNLEAFFAQGNVTRPSLQALVAEKHTAPEVKQAAQHLLGNPLTFGLLDNAKHGHGASPLHPANDGVISRADVLASLEGLSDTNLCPPDKHVGLHLPRTTAELSALVAMRASRDNDLPAKQARSGHDRLKPLGGQVMSTAGKVLDAVVIAIEGVGRRLPPALSGTAAGMALGVARFNTCVVGVAEDRLTGMSPRQAARNAFIGMATVPAGAAGPLTPAGGKCRLAANSARAVAEVRVPVGRESVQEGGEQGLRHYSKALITKTTQSTDENEPSFMTDNMIYSNEFPLRTPAVGLHPSMIRHPARGRDAGRDAPQPRERSAQGQHGLPDKAPTEHELSKQTEEQAVEERGERVQGSGHAASLVATELCYLQLNRQVTGLGHGVDSPRRPVHGLSEGKEEADPPKHKEKDQDQDQDQQEQQGSADTGGHRPLVVQLALGGGKSNMPEGAA